MYTIADVFYDSTPADKGVKPWRCAGKDRLEAVLSGMGYTKQAAYVCHEGQCSLIVGLCGQYDSHRWHRTTLEFLRDELQNMADSEGLAITCKVVDCGPYRAHILITE